MIDSVTTISSAPAAASARAVALLPAAGGPVSNRGLTSPTLAGVPGSRAASRQRLSAYTCSMICNALMPSAGSIQNGLPAAACAWKSAISSSWETPQ